MYRNFLPVKKFATNAPINAKCGGASGGGRGGMASRRVFSRTRRKGAASGGREEEPSGRWGGGGEGAPAWARARGVVLIAGAGPRARACVVRGSGREWPTSPSAAARGRRRRTLYTRKNETRREASEGEPRAIGSVASSARIDPRFWVRGVSRPTPEKKRSKDGSDSAEPRARPIASSKNPRQHL